jgi:hypothetical protein
LQSHPLLISTTYKALYSFEEGLPWGTNDATWRYNLSGEELLLTPESGAGLALRWKRPH